MIVSRPCGTLDKIEVGSQSSHKDKKNKKQKQKQNSNKTEQNKKEKTKQNIRRPRHSYYYTIA